MRAWNKLTAHRGETLTYTLAAILVVALSSAVLAAMVGAASRMNATAIQQDQTLYTAVTAAETQPDSAKVTAEDPPQVTVTVGGHSVVFGGSGTGSITYYSDTDGTLYSYRYSKTGG